MRPLALAAVVLLALSASASTGLRAQGGEEAPPTHVVFALDDSGSMFDASGSDPGMQRYDGVVNLVEVLGKFLDQDDPRRVEIGALSFGTEARELSPLASVRGGSLAEALRVERDRASSRGATDFREALCLAWETVTGEAAPRDSGCPGATGSSSSRSDDARRLVVLVTDGAPAPGSDALEFSSAPDASACSAEVDVQAFEESRETGAADSYLCALGSVWANLNRHTRVTLVVIGLDQRDRWFDGAAPYWRRAADCSPSPTTPCDRVVRSVDADSLAELILGAYPTVDLCKRVDEGEPFNCDIPGGLTGVQFLITGVPNDGVTTVGDGRDTRRSDEGHPEFKPLEGDTHKWTFKDRPYSGPYQLTLEAPTLPPDALVFVDYKVAEFSVGEQVWDEEAGELTLHLTVVAGGQVFPRSAEAQPYEAELLDKGRTTRQSVTLDHVDGSRGSEFTVSVKAEQGDSEFTLYLDLGDGRGRIQVARETIPPSVFISPTPTPAATTAPTPTATPPPTAAPTPSPTATPVAPVTEEEEPEEGGSDLLPWIIILVVVALLVTPFLISAYSVRHPQPYNRQGDEAPPIELAVPDADYNPRDLVRAGTFAWRDAPPTEADGVPRTVMLRWLIAGPLVVRRTSKMREDWGGSPIVRDRGYGDTPRVDEEVAEGIELHRRPDGTDDDY